MKEQERPVVQLVELVPGVPDAFSCQSPYNKNILAKWEEDLGFLVCI